MKLKIILTTQIDHYLGTGGSFGPSDQVNESHVITISFEGRRIATVKQIGASGETKGPYVPKYVPSSMAADFQNLFVRAGMRNSATDEFEIELASKELAAKFLEHVRNFSAGLTVMRGSTSLPILYHSISAIPPVSECFLSAIRTVREMGSPYENMRRSQVTAIERVLQGRANGWLQTLSEGFNRELERTQTHITLSESEAIFIFSLMNFTAGLVDHTQQFIEAGTIPGWGAITAMSRLKRNISGYFQECAFLDRPAWLALYGLLFSRIQDQRARSFFMPSMTPPMTTQERTYLFQQADEECMRLIIGKAGLRYSTIFSFVRAFRQCASTHFPVWTRQFYAARARVSPAELNKELDGANMQVFIPATLPLAEQRFNDFFTLFSDICGRWHIPATAQKTLRTRDELNHELGALRERSSPSEARFIGALQAFLTSESMEALLSELREPATGAVSIGLLIINLLQRGFTGFDYLGQEACTAFKHLLFEGFMKNKHVRNAIYPNGHLMPTMSSEQRIALIRERAEFMSDLSALRLGRVFERVLRKHGLDLLNTFYIESGGHAVDLLPSQADATGRVEAVLESLGNIVGRWNLGATAEKITTIRNHLDRELACALTRSASPSETRFIEAFRAFLGSPSVAALLEELREPTTGTAGVGLCVVNLMANGFVSFNYLGEDACAALKHLLAAGLVQNERVREAIYPDGRVIPAMTTEERITLIRQRAGFAADDINTLRLVRIIERVSSAHIRELINIFYGAVGGHAAADLPPRADAIASANVVLEALSNVCGGWKRVVGFCDENRWIVGAGIFALSAYAVTFLVEAMQPKEEPTPPRNYWFF